MQAAQVAKVQADAKDKNAQAIERLHRIAADHADLSQQPVLPGVGRIAPADNPLLQPPPGGGSRPASRRRAVPCRPARVPGAIVHQPKEPYP